MHSSFYLFTYVPIKKRSAGEEFLGGCSQERKQKEKKTFFTRKYGKIALQEEAKNKEMKPFRTILFSGYIALIATTIGCSAYGRQAGGLLQHNIA